MDIEDIVDRKEFRESDKKFNEYLIEEMNKYVKPKLVDYMYSVFGDEKKARNWFYSEIWSLQQRPYDCCKAGRNDLVENVLNAIEVGSCA